MCVSLLEKNVDLGCSRTKCWRECWD